jgi:hypothetical protein
MFSTFLCVCVCVSWLKRVEEKRKENSSINQLPNEEASNAMRHNSTHTQKEAIHSNQIVRRCLLLLHPRPKQQQQQRNTRMKSEISPFFLFCFKTKKCWNSFSHQKPSIKPFFSLWANIWIWSFFF